MRICTGVQMTLATHFGKIVCEKLNDDVGGETLLSLSEDLNISFFYNIYIFILHVFRDCTSPMHVFRDCTSPMHVHPSLQILGAHKAVSDPGGQEAQDGRGQHPCSVRAGRRREGKEEKEGKGVW
jgi:hypothetical protein